MKLSARNVLKGRVVKVIRGQTTAHVKIDVGGGSVVTASITVEAVDELGLREGDVAFYEAAGRVKSSRVDSGVLRSCVSMVNSLGGDHRSREVPSSFYSRS